jgi:hypothetical protein
MPKTQQKSVAKNFHCGKFFTSPADFTDFKDLFFRKKVELNWAGRVGGD